LVPAGEVDLTGLGVRVGVAVCRVCEGAIGGRERVELKWPNDVLVGSRKAAGCLCEVVPRGADGRAWLIVGVGINVNNASSDLPADLRRAPISLGEVRGGALDLGAMAERLRDELAAVVDAPLAGAVLDEARARLFGVGTRQSFRDAGGGSFEGVVAGLDGTGGLLVRAADGTTRAVTSVLAGS
ncbi:MAG: hypothetical protein IBJ11_11390, partial [Phycisphaerales bacterium]|nr:hypothetical protein [Phycisphaerales bacterium]